MDACNIDNNELKSPLLKLCNPKLMILIKAIKKPTFDDPNEKLQSVASPALEMVDCLYSSVDVTYHMCACSAPAHTSSPVAASVRLSMYRKAARG